MSMSIRALLALSLSTFLAVISVARADEPKDAYGDTLPAGAKARLGTARVVFWRIGDLVALPPDYKSFAAIEQQRGVIIWNIENGRVLRRLEQAGPFIGRLVAVSANGTRLATWNVGTVTIWDIPTGREVLRFKPGPGAPTVANWHGHNLFSLSGDGKLLAIGGWPAERKANAEKAAQAPEMAITIWDVEKNERFARLEVKTNEVLVPLLSSDGEILASWTLPAAGTPIAPPVSNLPNVAPQPRPTSDPTRALRIWEVKTGKLLSTVQMPMSAPSSVELTQNGRMIAVCFYDRPIERWQTRTGKTMPPLQGSDGRRQHVAFTPDGQALAAVGMDGVVRRWAMADDRMLGETVTPASNLPPGIAFGINEELVVWRGSTRCYVAKGMAKSGKLISPRHEQSPEIVGISFGADGKHVMTSAHGKRLVRWDSATGKPLGSIDIQLDFRQNPNYYEPVGVSLSLDATRALWPPGPAGTTSTQLYDAATGSRLFTLPSPPKTCRTECLATPDMSRLARVSVPIDPNATTATCEVWELPNQKKLKEFTLTVVTESGERLLDPINFSYRRLSLSPDGTRLVSITTAQRKPRVPGQAPTLPDLLISGWDLSTGKLLSTTRAPFDLIRGIKAVSNTAAVYVANSGAVRAVDHERGVLGLEIDRIRIDSMPVIMAISPDSTRLAIGVADKDGLFGVRVYDWPRGKLLRTFSGHSAPISCLAFSPDGKTLASGSHDTTVLLWDISKIGE